MTKTLKQHRNRYALVIDRTMMDLLKITEKTRLDLKIQGDRLIVTPVRENKRRSAVMQAYAHVSRKHSAFLKRLA